MKVDYYKGVRLPFKTDLAKELNASRSAVQKLAVRDPKRVELLLLGLLKKREIDKKNK